MPEPVETPLDIMNLIQLGLNKPLNAKLADNSNIIFELFKKNRQPFYFTIMYIENEGFANPCFFLS